MQYKILTAALLSSVALYGAWGQEKSTRRGYLELGSGVTHLHGGTSYLEHNRLENDPLKLMSARNGLFALGVFFADTWSVSYISLAQMGKYTVQDDVGHLGKLHKQPEYRIAANMIAINYHMILRDFEITLYGALGPANLRMDSAYFTDVPVSVPSPVAYAVSANDEPNGVHGQPAVANVIVLDANGQDANSSAVVYAPGMYAHFRQNKDAAMLQCGMTVAKPLWRRLSVVLEMSASALLGVSQDVDMQPDNASRNLLQHEYDHVYAKVKGLHLSLGLRYDL